jgi:hypothetical protein
MLAHLRIAGVVTFAVARLATDLAGYSLVVRVSHPLFSDRFGLIHFRSFSRSIS